MNAEQPHPFRPVIVGHDPTMVCRTCGQWWDSSLHPQREPVPAPNVTVAASGGWTVEVDAACCVLLRPPNGDPPQTVTNVEGLCHALEHGGLVATQAWEMACRPRSVVTGSDVPRETS